MTDRYAVFGNPIAHSKSPQLHRLFAEKTDEDIEYTAQLVATDKFVATATTFFNDGGKGLNITVPFKKDAFDFADKLTPRAQLAGAVNTLILNDDQSITGDNTDGAGIIDDMVNNLHWQLKGKKILVLGAGGAVRGILEPLCQQQPASITITNRTLDRAIALRDIFSNVDLDISISAKAFSDLANERFDIIINGTSASLSGDLPPIPNSVLHAGSACYDMMYGAKPTIFMQWAHDNGAKNIADGLGMLVCQGAESFTLWRHKKPKTQPVIDTLRKEFSL